MKIVVALSAQSLRAEMARRGEYPRLAELPARYITKQLQNFRSCKRINIPMFPYTEERELSDEDIRAISSYLSGITLPTAQPKFKGDKDALTRLQMMEKVMIVPRVEGDIANGGKIYQDQCNSCHAKNGRGRGAFPMLVGQYSNYLSKQAHSFVKGERPHDEHDSRGVLAELKNTDIRDILGLSYIDSVTAINVKWPGTASPEWRNCDEKSPTRKADTLFVRFRLPIRYSSTELDDHCGD